MRFFKLICSILILLLLGFSFWMDLAFGLFTDWGFLGMITLIIMIWTVWLTKNLSNQFRLAIIASTLLMMLSTRYWDYNSLKPFMRTLDNLEKGMSKQDVINQMRDYELAGQGKGFIFVSEQEAEPHLKDKVEFLNFTHTEEGWGDSDWGFVYFIDNKLYRIGFSHD